jgi:pyruvate formate lyase activating enzyme
MINGRRIYYPEKCIVCGACLDACIYNALEITGSRYTAMELYELLMKDVDYYRASGGGVTFSGGEPLLQTEFLRELSSLLKESGVHVALDTAFSVPWKQVERLLSLVDLILLDIKSMDREKHFAYTGVFPDLIWENAEKLAQTDMKILVRMPLIYGINDGVAEIAAAAAFIQKWEHLVGVELLKYHNLGVDKSHCYGRLKKQQTFLPPSERRMKEIVDIFEQVGISVL